MSTENAEAGDPNTFENDLSKEEIQGFIEEFAKLERDFKEMEKELEPYLDRQLKDLAGPHLNTMLMSKDDTLTFLSHTNPRLRQASLQLAYRHWHITDKLATEYERMALTDSDSEVRLVAISALGTCYARSKHPRIGHLLATFVRNESVDDSIRLTAFISLLRLNRNMDYRGTSPLVPVSLDQIDWDFVDHYYINWKGDD